MAYKLAFLFCYHLDIIRKGKRLFEFGLYNIYALPNCTCVWVFDLHWHTFWYLLAIVRSLEPLVALSRSDWFLRSSLSNIPLPCRSPHSNNQIMRHKELEQQSKVGRNAFEYIDGSEQRQEYIEIVTQSYKSKCHYFPLLHHTLVVIIKKIVLPKQARPISFRLSYFLEEYDIFFKMDKKQQHQLGELKTGPFFVLPLYAFTLHTRGFIYAIHLSSLIYK